MIPANDKYWMNVIEQVTTDNNIKLLVGIGSDWKLPARYELKRGPEYKDGFDWVLTGVQKFYWPYSLMSFDPMI